MCVAAFIFVSLLPTPIGFGIEARSFAISLDHQDDQQLVLVVALTVTSAAVLSVALFLVLLSCWVWKLKDSQLVSRLANFNVMQIVVI